MKKATRLMLTLSLGIALFAGNAMAGSLSGGDAGYYKITITNLTRGTLFTPPLAVSHGSGVKVFTEGEPASDALAQLAEGGNSQPVQEELFATGKAKDAASNPGPVFPGQSATIMVKAGFDARFISLVAMMVPTNDGFIALNGVKAPFWGQKKVFLVRGYDAGSEMNDEHCTTIPGPQCGGEGYNPAGGEGYVHTHAGIHGIGDLVAADYDWRNPVARITVEHVR